MCVHLTKKERMMASLPFFIQQMWNTDEEVHFSYFRMCAAWFNDLLKRVLPYVKCAKTHRSPISTTERLALTLRVLVCGATQQSVAETFKIGSCTARKMVAEMYEAIWIALR